MNKKLKSILLIDDDDAVNFINERVISLTGCAEKVVALQSATSALDYLKSNSSSKEFPELIFLDINMPSMNGWEFVEEYSKMGDQIENKGVLLMLTTSINPDDKERADAIPIIDGFMSKPLTVDVLNCIMDKKFG